MKNKYLKYGSIILCVLILIGVIVKFSFKTKSATSANVKYRAVEVKKGDIQVTASGTGSIEANERKEIKTLASGVVDMIYVEEGQYVDKGNLILTFDNDKENSSISQAKLNVLMEEKNLKDLQENLEELKIYAPVTGFVEELNANIGEEISKGHVFATIIDKSKLELVARFNKSQIDNIEIGDKAEVLLLDSLTTHEGTVIKINKTPEAYQGGVLYQVTIEVGNPGGLESGTEAQVTVKNNKGSIESVGISELEDKKPYYLEVKTGGTVTKLNVSEGDYVKQGELLAELENPDLLLNIEQQKLKLEQTRLQLNDKLKGLEDTALYAPISGVITELTVTVGETVHENSTVAVISDLNRFKVVVPIDELDIGKIKTGQQALVEVEASQKKNYSAEVTKIALEGETTGGVATFDVTLNLNDNTGLKPGMTANVEIVVTKKENVLLLPIEALQQRNNRQFVLTGSSTDLEQGKLKLTPVEIGLVSENYVEIIKGLNEGDKVYIPISTSNSQSQQTRPGMGMMPIGGRPPQNRRD
ncbi:MAG: HlyD family secretion protein [Thermosediminibacterales bacterium]|nr:HlyD family secretion protein [Thermosediminibacterales bacterium]